MVVIMVAGACLLSSGSPAHAAESVGVLEDYDKTTDIGQQILPGGKYEMASGIWNETFCKAISFDNQSYNLTANVKYTEQPDEETEGIRFIVAKATDRYYGTTVYMEVNVRGEHVHIFARNEDGSKEEVVSEGWYLSKSTKGQDNACAMRYEKGKLWFYENGNAIYEGFNLASKRYVSVEPAIGFVFELTGGSFHDIRLWGKGVSYYGAFPGMPSGNGNYADYMGVKSWQGTSVNYENGVLYSTQNCTDLIGFTKLPFQNTETFAWSFRLNVKEAAEPWDGARIVLRADADYQEMYQLAILENALIVLHGEEEVVTTRSYSRTLGTADQFDLLFQADTVSVWVNGVLVLERVPLGNTLPANMGMKFEVTHAAMGDISFYYTDSVPFTEPEKDPTIPVMTAAMYNAAQYMVVMNGNEEYSYQDYQITHSSAKENGKYLFTNVPLPENATYTYRATVQMNSGFKNPVWGPRLIFRTGAQGDIHVALCQERVLILAGNSVELASTPMKIEAGKKYDVAIYSTPDYVNVWIDGTLIFHKVSLSPTGEKTKAKAGILFEVCDATLSDIKIYGADVVFSGDIFDEELRNNKWFNSAAVPQMPAGNHNYFTNVKLGGATSTGYDQAYQEGVFHSPISGMVVQGDFVDQNNSHSLNGLKKSATYVWSSKVKINEVDWQITQLDEENRQDASVIFVFKESEHPSGENGYYMSLCLVHNRIELQVWQNHTLAKSYYDDSFRLQDGKEYQVDLLVGETWAKVWVDDELIYTAYDLPSYQLKFMLAIQNVDVDVYDNVVYEVEEDSAKILEVKQAYQPLSARNTVLDKEAEDIPVIAVSWTAVILPLVITALVLAALVTAVCVGRQYYKKKRTQNEKGEQDL